MDDAFSYTCNGCGRCCQGKHIQVNPYEVAAIAGHLGVTTTAVRERHLAPTRAHLGHRPDGFCIFFDDGGCSIHPARPLVCRLYPLGISRDAGGGLSVMSHPPHPLTEGVYGRAGTVADWVRNQEAETHLRAAEAYHALFVDLTAAVNAGRELDLDPEALMDLDPTVARYAAQTGVAEPEDLTHRHLLHIEAIRSACGLDVPGRP